ncbi:MAG: hypothetical protein CFE23_04935 [Flavobacterium sp. BFFFF1]|uniref:hypothetical protein n=1 Tax=Flavobacterium sp. BFFFF1 TaxID=2015557 RepID=UPI000BD1C5CA|nr:hypothetical protein [Flavobacterium sp. BFFFF1]OYU81433.1 MAG: hypothetical protein CFE23_04935 [Flavobacterium sp. BFFFF1]
MPIENLGKTHLTEVEMEQINQALAAIEALVMPLTVNLNHKDKLGLCKVGEHNKLLINKVRDYAEMSPELRSPDVDWEEFRRDYATRSHASAAISRLQSLEGMLRDMKALNDHDNYTDALKDYRFAQYKTQSSQDAGYSTKAEQMKPFFPKTGKKKR